MLAAGHAIELVVTQPDRVRGRDQDPSPPPVKLLAQEAGLPVVQPEKIKNNPDFRARLEAIKPDAIIVVAYGRIIPDWMLNLPRLGNLNLHASLLPKYRGAAPIQWAVANGETVTGATTMRIDQGLDTGDMLLQRSLLNRTEPNGRAAFPVVRGEWCEASCARRSKGWKQVRSDPFRRTMPQHPWRRFCSAKMPWSTSTRSAIEIYNRWRGFQPWPGAYTLFRGRKLTLHRLIPAGSTVAPRGEMMVEGSRLFVAAGSSTRLELLEVQMEGKKRLPVADFLRGAGLQAHERLGS